MEQKSEGTPNPLNPNAEKKPTEINSPEVVKPVEKIEPSEKVDSPKPEQESVPLDANPSEPMQEVVPIKIKVNKTAKPVNTADKPISKPIKVVGGPEDKPVGPISEPARPVQPIDMVRPTPANVTELVNETPAQTIDAVQSSFANNAEQPAAPVPQPVPTPTPVSTPIPAPVVTPRPTPTPVPQNPEGLNTMGVITDISGAPIQNDPTYRPMQKMPAPITSKPKSRKRKALFVCVLILIFLAIGCAVLATLIFMNINKGDPVAVAMNKLVSGEAPENVAVNGAVTMDMSKSDSPIANFKLQINAEVSTKAWVNSGVATLTVNSKNGKSVSAELSEIYAANGEVFLKIDGITDLLDDGLWTKQSVAVDTQSQSVENEVTNEETTPNEAEANEEKVQIILEEVFKNIRTKEGTWIKVPVDDLGTVLDSSIIERNELTCAAKFAIDANNGIGNILSGSYLNYPFITSTDKNLTVESVRNPIYKIIIDEENFRSFVQETENSVAMSNLTSCLGYKSYENKADKLTAAVQKLPNVYVEVDENNNFTRLYSTMGLVSTCCTEGAECTKECENRLEATVTVDFNFAYLDTVNVPEPVEYQNWRDVDNADNAENTDATEDVEATETAKPNEAAETQ